MIFIWSTCKASINLRKHGIDFKQITSLFEDHNSKIIYDEKGTEKGRTKGYDEDRWILFAFSGIYNRWLRISYTVTDDSEVRIFSARKASKADLENGISNL